MFDAGTFSASLATAITTWAKWITAHVAGPLLISQSAGFTKVLRDYCGRIDHILQVLMENGWIFSADIYPFMLLLSFNSG